ncbi:MAG: hypothetical protein ACM31L_02625 [Actinomycetota bacterium]
MAHKKPSGPDRSHGGPGSSHQDATDPPRPREASPQPGEPTNRAISKVSGGGGERDRHHSHDPARK